MPMLSLPPPGPGSITPVAVTVTLPKPLLNWRVVTSPVTVISAANAVNAPDPPNANKLTRKYFELGLRIMLLRFLLIFYKNLFLNLGAFSAMDSANSLKKFQQKISLNLK
jgi:hypothetical protein